MDLMGYAFFKAMVKEGGGGGDITVESLDVKENGTTTAPEGKAYSPVNVNVPNSYTAADEGKVVSGGALVAQTSRTVTANGPVDTTTNDEVVVDVQPVLEPLSVTDNGDYTPGAGVDGFSRVLVNVPSKTSLAGATLTPGPNKTYTGQEQTQTGTVVSNSVTLVEGQDYTLSGDRGTNAGDYTLVATGINNFLGSKSALWSIAKAQGSISVSPNTLAIDGAGSTDTATITKVGDGTVSASSSDAGVATASVSGDTVTVTAVGAGTATITVTMADGDNYMGASATIAVEVTSSVNVFGVHWPYSTSDSTALTRLTLASDPNGYVTTSVDTEPVPAVGDGAGSSPFDAFAPWKDMEEYNVIDGALSYKKGEAGFSRTDYDTVVKLPDAYTKIVDTGTDMYFYVADGPVEGFALHPGSGGYVGRYHTGTGYVSKSGLPAEVNMTRATARTNSHAKGADWWQWGIASWQLIQILYLVEFADFNSQAKIGTGIAYSGGVAQNSGATDSMIYHTGRAAGTDGRTAIQYRGVENLWGNYYAWLDGVNFSNRAAYVCIDPASYADDTTTGYTDTGLTLPSSGYVNAMGVSSSAPWLMLPKNNGGSQTTYVSDYVYSSTGWRVAQVAGRYYAAHPGVYGLFYLGAYSTSSNTGADSGSRLLFLP